MVLIAALGMYDRAETMAANDRFWAQIKAALREMGQDAPDRLTRGTAALMQAWQSPDLLFAQTCSLPFRAKLAGRVQIIATPDYGLEGCPAGYYRSVYVAKRGNGALTLPDLAGRPFAYNEGLSHSGWAAPWADHVARGLTIRPTLATGSHHASAQSVAEGRADYAALDALTWDMIQRYDPFAADLIAIDYTPPSPALPFITAQNPAPLRSALGQAITDLPAADRATLHLRGVVDIAQSSYLSLPIPPTPTGS